MDSIDEQQLVLWWKRMLRNAGYVHEQVGGVCRDKEDWSKARLMRLWMEDGASAKIIQQARETELYGEVLPKGKIGSTDEAVVM